MKLFFAIILTYPMLMAFPIELESIASDFNQTICDDQNKTIVYTGTMKAKKPALAYWHYATPVQKDIYVANSGVTIIEPDLEQAIVKKLDNTIDLISILKSSKEINPTHYLALYNGREYHIHLKNKTLSSIDYNDDFGNFTTINFFNVLHNGPIDSATLKAVIPKGFDIIR